VNEREHQHSGEDCRIIGMPDVVKRPGGHDAEARRIHHLDVPVFPERSNHPPATAFAARNTANIAAAEQRNKRGGAIGRLRRSTRQHGGVPGKTIQRNCGRRPSPRARDHPPLVASGDAQLHEPQQSHGEEQRKKREHTRSIAVAETPR